MKRLAVAPFSLTFLAAPLVAWARLLDPARDEVARIRATDAIERNTKLLLATLACPPR